jgi:multimeric flavodoxin WrbA
MKVLLINGSPRKNGNTATALAEIQGQVKEEGIESEEDNNMKFDSYVL